MSHTALALLHQFGYGFVFLLLTLEATGLPLPGETVMVGAALYAARTHHLALLPLFVVAAGGAVAGGIIGYTIGRRFGPALLDRYGPRIGFDADRRLLGRYLLQRNGAAFVFWARFVAVLRSVAGILAGVNAMNTRRFMLFNALGGIVWTGLYCCGAYLLGHEITRIAGVAGPVLGITAVAVLIAAVVFIRRHEGRLITLARSAEGSR